MDKLLLRISIAGAVIYGAVWAARKYDLVTKVNAVASHLIVRGVGVANDLLTKYDQATSTDDGSKPKPEAEAGPDPKSTYGSMWHTEAR